MNKTYLLSWIMMCIGIITYAQTPQTLTFSGPTTGDHQATERIVLTTGFQSTSFSATIVQDAYTAPTLTQTENYIYTRTYQRGMTTANGIQYNNDVIEGVTYFDGLGRPKQQIGIKATPDKRDITNHIIYDEHGRQDKQHLPFVQQNGTVGSYQTVDLVADINSYYQNKYADDFTGMAVGDVNAYSQSIYEPSPLNRVLEQGAPGKAWKADPTTDSDHTIKFDWGTNEANEVVRFSVTYANGNTENPTLTQHGAYSANELHLSLTKDENWKATDGDNRTTKEYKNKLGQVVLKRTYNEDVAHDTYYIYDDFGNLTYVIPPKVDITNNVSATELSELCYQYKYDKRNRLVEKKIPGKGWDYIIYNKIDQPVLTQDANQRANNEWLFTKYDAFGRVTYTGLYKQASTLSRVAMQNSVYNATSQYESRSNPASNLAQTTVYYTNNAAPTSINKVYTINYYDNYAFDHAATNPGSVYNQTIDTEVKGLATGSKVRVLGTDNWITTVTYYDSKGRPIYLHNSNTYLNTTDVVETKLDFAGKVLETKTTHTKGSNAPIVTVDTFTYDHTGRAIKQSQKINNQTTEQLVNNTYDEIGQLEKKEVGGGLQAVDYTYNVRGWLQSINDVANLGNDLFAFGINYNAPQNGAEALYNGNISETLWRTANDDTQRHYTYDYDGLNRITAATSNDNRYNLSNVTYDSMGNILTLTRGGHLNEAATSFGVMDNLAYTYYNGGNQLKSVSETVAQAVGFTKNSTTGTDYTYDPNGNMITDNNKGITGITYNHLNLPEQTYVSNSTTSGNISYIYDATGAKLKKIATEGSSITTTEYANGYIYKNGQLEFFNHTEGYIEPNTLGGYDYVYQYKDHLGNIRLSYSDKDNDGKIDILRNNADIDKDNDYAHEILEENNYYPFGMKHRGYNQLITNTNTALKFKYNGIEQEESLGLNLYEMPLRQYDPTIARWTSIDPVTHYSMSTYNGYDNNPIFWADPSGADVEQINGGVSYTGEHAQLAFGALQKQYGSTDPKKKKRKKKKKVTMMVGELQQEGVESNESGEFYIDTGFDINAVSEAVGYVDLGIGFTDYILLDQLSNYEDLLKIPDGHFQGFHNGQTTIWKNGFYGSQSVSSNFVKELKIDFAKNVSKGKGLTVASGVTSSLGLKITGLTIGLDTYNWMNGYISTQRYSYRMGFTGASIGTGAAIGGPPGALAGTLVGLVGGIGEAAYDMWEITKKNLNFNFTVPNINKGFSMFR